VTNPSSINSSHPQRPVLRSLLPAQRPSGLGYWWATFLGVALIPLGLVISGGGVWLIWLGGSPYYLIAGIGLVVSGIQLLRHQIAAVSVYFTIWLATLIWAYWEVGFNGWALVPRIVAPTLILAFVLIAVPGLVRTASRGSKLIYAAAVVVAVSLLGGALLARGVRPGEAWSNEPAAKIVQSQLPTNDVGQTKPQTSSVEVGTAGREAFDRKTTDAGVAISPVAGKTLQAGRDWPAYGGSAFGTRYSPLDQITIDNVSRLEKVWIYRTRDLPDEQTKKTYRSENGKHSPETTPLKVADHLFMCSARNVLISVSAGLGKEEWRFDPKVADEAIPYGATCRGVAYYERMDASPDQHCAARILEGTLDARLIAVDAKTGRPCADFGQNGSVDLTVGLGETVPGWYAVTSPPTIVRGIVVTGAQVFDGQSEDAPSGVIRGYDAVTGKLAWAWDMGHPDRSGAPPDGDTYTRGTPNMWTAAAGDEELGYVYAPLGNSAVDYFGGNRKKFENDYSTSLVAIDVTTGKAVWHFQTVRYDLWDYDLSSQPSLVDFPTAAGTVPALILSSKQGQIYVLNRKTGQSLFPVEDRVAPGGGVEPQNLAKTQPYSGYAHLDQAELTEKDMWGMSPIDQLWCRIQFKRASYDGEYTAPTLDRAYIQYPGFNGGSEWGSVAVDTERGILVANYNDTPNLNWLVPREKIDKMGLKPINQWAITKSTGDDEDLESRSPLAVLRLWMRTWRTFYWADPQVGAPYGIHVNAGWLMPTGLPCKQPPFGRIRAIEVKTGKTLWDYPFGSARNNGPFGISSMLPITIGTPNNGGPLVTAGGLIFVAATTDDTFRAIDIKTGKVVWEDQLPAGGQATPMTYEADGRQFVVIAAGGHHFMKTRVGDYVVAYALAKAR
jgi:quinoprotein glucose dehydrogenase